MSRVEWSDDLSVHVAELDEQHKRLVGILNDLQEAMRGGQAKGRLGEILERLIDHTESHFSAEERYFDRLEHPQADAHRREHQDFVEQIRDFKKGFDRGSAPLSVTVMNFLVDWTKYHIQGSDKSLAPFVSEHGPA